MNPSKETLVYECNLCHELYYDKSKADYCCQDRTCSICGIVIGKNDYYTICEACKNKKQIERQQELFEKAEKLTWVEYQEKYPNHMISWGDNYYPDIDYIYDEFYDNEDELPDYVWGTTVSEIEICPFELIQDFEERADIEDYEMDSSAASELIEFFKDWNKRNPQTIYYETNKVAILINKEEKK